MPNKAADKRFNKMNSVYTWSFLVSPGKEQRCNRRLIRFLSEVIYQGEIMGEPGFKGDT